MKVKSDIIISFFLNSKSKKPIPTSLGKIMYKLKTGAYEKMVTQARHIMKNKGKSYYDHYRVNSIPCFTPALNLKDSGKSNFSQDDYTGLLPLDIDDPNQNQDENAKILIAIPWIVVVGKSLGGKGLFAIARCDPTKYNESYDAAVKILHDNGVIVAKGQSNPNRLRFITTDPRLYYNDDPVNAPMVPLEIDHSLSANAPRIDEPKDGSKDVDRIEIFKIIVKIKSKGVNIWPIGERHSYLISVLTWCNKIGMSQNFILNAVEQICRPMMQDGKDYDIASQVKDVYMRYHLEHGTQEWDPKKPPKTKFWFVDAKGKLIIIRQRLMRFLESEGGFYEFHPDPKNKTNILIRMHGPFIDETNTEEIKKFVEQYIQNLPEEECGANKSDIIEAIYRGSDTFFSRAQLEFISTMAPNFLRHTKDTAYFPFKNGIVEVTAANIELKPYDQFDKKIWLRDVIDFEISIHAKIQGEYYEFIKCISNTNEDRTEFACTLIGYLLHNYKDPTKPFAAILCEESENEDEGGGTGKGIFIQGLLKIINGVKIDGKNFKTDKSFAFQRVRLDTRFIAIEDARIGLDFESFYSIITEGITIERKNKDEIFIPYTKSPKIIFTTNYTIVSEGTHGKRRQVVLEFSNFFHLGYTPEDKFGHRLFDDWIKDEWNKFYNFMFACVCLYLNNGIKEVCISSSIRRKQIKLKFTQEFLTWWDRYVSDAEGWDLFSDLYVNFKNTFDFTDREYSSIKFTKALFESARVFGYKLERRISRHHNNKVQYKLQKLEA
jgi:hypothetical protein